jgi:hypothetical protein
MSQQIENEKREKETIESKLNFLKGLIEIDNKHSSTVILANL